MQKRSWILLGATAGGAVATALVVRSRPRRLQITKSMTIQRPLEEVYGAWRDLENLPRSMRHLKSVKLNGPGRSHWVVDAPAGARIEWDAEFTEQHENKRLAWHSLPGSDIEHSGTVQFRPAPANRGTEITVQLGYTSRLLGSWLGSGAERLIVEDLRRFKAQLEAGEIPTTIGQPHGKRSAIVETFQPLDREQFRSRNRTAGT